MRGLLRPDAAEYDIDNAWDRRKFQRSSARAAKHASQHGRDEGRMKSIPSIEDLRRIARRKVPKMFFDYADAGSYNQETLRANRADLERIKLRQRVLVDVDSRDTSTTILGETAALPLALAPIGLGGMMHGDGEILACRAAQAAGIPYTLSTMSINSIEDVAGAVDKPFWFQLYVMRDRGFIRELIQRAAAAKCSALMLTVDLQVLGQRHVDLRNGLTVPPEIKIRNLIDIATRPAWAFSVLKGKRKTFGNLAGHVKGMENINSLAQWTASQFDPTLSWKDVEWIKAQWPGKLLLKGILDVEDARTAVKTGVAAISVSNHGGRQLDGAPSAITALPKVVDAVGAEIEVMMDSGIRTGADLVRALALGARSCIIGRSYIYGLGAGGQAGVARAIEILGKELDVTMALCGVKSIRDIDRRVLAEWDSNA
jgi:L-lactate dehydrogenase (cytochrome)